MMPRSLRARVTVLGVLTLAVILSVGGWLTVRTLASALRSDLSNQNSEVLELLAEQIDLGEDPRQLRIPVGADGTDFLILDSDGVPLNASFFQIAVLGPEFSLDGVDAVDVIADPSLSPPAFGSEEELIEFIIATDPFIDSAADFEAQSNAETLTADWFETRRDIVTADGEELTLVALSPFEVLSRGIDRLALALFVIVPLVVALGGVALWFAMGSALEPVARLSAEARSIAPSTSGVRLDVPESGDEIADLTLTLNEMLQRLDTGLIRQRQFVSDASHELRSPLTTVKGVGEVVSRDERLPSDLRPSVDALNRGINRLESVLDDLIELADAGAGDTALRVEIDLADLILDEIAANGGTAERPTVAIDTSDVEPAVAMAYPVRLGRAVRNLMDNAIRHADTKVRVASEVRAGIVSISVEDDGAGVPASERERVFDRFVRLDDARDRSGGGSGLGLAIVAAIASEHGGSVVCDASPLGGARFVLSFEG